MAESQRYALIEMMNAIIRVPWCPPDIRARAESLLAALIPGYGFAPIFDNIFDAGSTRQ